MSGAPATDAVLRTPLDEALLDADKAGWLQHSTSRRSFYFVLKDRTLLWYPAASQDPLKPADQPKSSLSITSSCKAQPNVTEIEAGRPFSFLVRSPKKHLKLRAESQADMGTWMLTIESVAKKGHAGLTVGPSLRDSQVGPLAVELPPRLSLETPLGLYPD